MSRLPGVFCHQLCGVVLMARRPVRAARRRKARLRKQLPTWPYSPDRGIVHGSRLRLADEAGVAYAHTLPVLLIGAGSCDGRSKSRVLSESTGGSNFRKFWHAARDAVGLPGLHFHDLCRAGVDLSGEADTPSA